MAAEVAARLLEQNLIDFVLCFSPSINISQGIKHTFSKRLECRFDGVIGAVGCSYTYQSMISFKKDFWQLLKQNRVLVIFDEIHHCAGSSLEDTNSWGEEILLNIQAQSEYTLALTGTPWRSDQAPIALSRYTDPDNQILCDYIYGLKEAIADGVCRSPKIVLIDNERISVTNKENETKSYTCLDDLFRGSSVSYQSVIKNNVAIRHALTLATNKLDDIRQHNPNAAGLVVASSIDHAEYIVNLLRNEYVQTAEIVTYREEQPSHRINQFKSSKTNWIVSVGMISEGTDIPRLQVCCHLSRVKTELYFRQVLGRILRINTAVNQEAWLYTLAAPKLVEFAHRIDAELPESKVMIKEPTKLFEYSMRGEGYQKKIPPSSESSDNHSISFAEFNNVENSGIPPQSKTNCGVASLDFTGGFREQVISTFDSPF